MISQQYADDTSWITSNKQRIKNLQKLSSEWEQDRNMKSKEEEKKIGRNAIILPDTEEDTKPRKVLATDAYNQLSIYLKARKQI